MTREQWLQQQNDILLAIASQAKRLLLSDEIDDSGRMTPEIDRLCNLIERFEDEFSELDPKLKPLGRKPWYANASEKGQVTGLGEVMALYGQGKASQD